MWMMLGLILNFFPKNKTWKQLRFQFFAVLTPLSVYLLLPLLQSWHPHSQVGKHWSLVSHFSISYFRYFMLMIWGTWLQNYTTLFCFNVFKVEKFNFTIHFACLLLKSHFLSCCTTFNPNCILFSSVLWPKAIWEKWHYICFGGFTDGQSFVFTFLSLHLAHQKY